MPLVSVLVLGVIASCSSDSEGDSPSGSGAGSSSGGGFRAEASLLCTKAVNDHLITEDRHASIEVLQQIVKDEEPSAEDYEAWSEEIGAEVERREAIREALGGISPDDADDKAHWEEIVAAGDQDLELTTTRSDLLESKDWDQISEDWSRAEDDRTAEEALVALGLEGTDCVAPYAPAVVPEESQDFVREVTTTCTEIGNRRHEADYDADADAVLDVLLQVHEDGGVDNIPESTAEGLSRIEAEWERTTEDFKAVDAEGAGDAKAWEDTVAAAKVRIEIFGDRADAVESGDEDTIRDAFDTSHYDHPGPAFDELGLSTRSCAGVRF